MRLRLGERSRLSALLASFGLDLVDVVTRVRVLFRPNAGPGARRGRVYGKGSRRYDGPRDPGRKRPAVTPGVLAGWRQAARLRALVAERAGLAGTVRTERRAAVRDRAGRKLQRVMKRLKAA